MKLRDLVYEDFLQYKLPSMFIICPFCSWKCDRENGSKICQNSSLIELPIKFIEDDVIISRYLANPITKAIVFGGLEPLEDFEDVLFFISQFRKQSNDPIVIYTGFYPEEIESQVNQLRNYSNIIVKFGRYLPNQEPHFDEVLGINLASNNQFAVKIT